MMVGLQDWRVRRLLKVRADDWDKVYGVRENGVCPCRGCGGDELFYELRGVEALRREFEGVVHVNGGAFCVKCGFSNSVWIPLERYEGAVVLYG